MQLTDKHIADFQMLYKRHFDAEIGKEEALEKGHRLIRLMQIILRDRGKIDSTETTQTAIRRN